MRQLPPEARPRERLWALGAEALADWELLAVLLGSGSSRMGVRDLAQALLARFGSLHEMAAARCEELADAAGVGRARAAAVQAALELGRRASGSRPRHGQKLGQASEVWTHMQARLAHLAIEEFWLLALDARNRLLFEACVARGCLTGVEVHPRDVFRPLIRASAAAVIFCHNHPSGDPSPSREDLELTNRLREVGHLCGIAVLDHVVVGGGGYVSLAARGWL